MEINVGEKYTVVTSSGYGHYYRKGTTVRVDQALPNGKYRCVDKPNARTHFTQDLRAEDLGPYKPNINRTVFKKNPN